ncbi:MAG: glutamine amidotransferase, partial [Planctomycetota bacterium]|nr:glutamine amidotransferase [Planctomycetota bacterium]
EYDWGRGGSAWVHELAEVGDGAAVRRAINNLVFGDMPDFTPTMNLALQGLANVNAGQKHCIIISDGDPAPPSRTLLQGFIDAKITISTVAVFPHGGPGSMDLVRMREIARITGGNYYQVTSQAQLASLPQIFVKEAQTVKRSLIWEGDPFTPTFVNLGLESMRGFGAAMPPMVGYVVTAEREGLSLVSMKSPQEDPILAQWQHGLGRSVAFTSDAATRWSPEWVTWEGFQAFWDQQLRWAMRPTGSANVNVITETQGDETLVIVEALDSAGERLNFAQFAGRVVTPEMDSEPVELRQTGAGRYEGRIRTEDAGSYVLNLRYDAVQQGEDGEPRVERGAVQAAVTRPFADEHRALKDNAPLLYEAARLTGGRVLDRSDAAPLLFSRAGLEMPVATRPIWLALALAGLALFLMDVAVRRVRIDVRAIVRAGRLALTKRRQAAGEQIDALRAAREKARGAMAERGSGGRVETPPQGPQAVRPATTKGVKFEASQEAFKRAEKGEMGSVTDSVKPKERPAAEKKTEAEKKKDEQPEEGMSRLLQAKKRAREQMRGDEDRKND